MTVKVTASVSAASLETAAVKAKGRPCATDGAALGLSRTETAARARLGRLSAAAAAAQASAKARLLLVDLGIFLSRLTCPASEPAEPNARVRRLDSPVIRIGAVLYHRPVVAPPRYSFVIPVFDEQETLPELERRPPAALRGPRRPAGGVP